MGGFSTDCSSNEGSRSGQLIRPNPKEEFYSKFQHHHNSER